MSKRTRRTAEKGTISEQLRAAIEDSGMSKYAICKAIDIGQPTMTRFMQGTSGLSLDTLDKLGELLGLELTKRKER